VGLEDSPPLKPKLILGVWCHMLLMRGVRPVPMTGLRLMTISFVNSGERVVDGRPEVCDGRRMKSVRAACSGSKMGSLILRDTLPKSPE
jgi:hypothetical protein